MKLGLVGKGRAGTALHNALRDLNAQPHWWWSRRDELSIDNLDAVDVVLIAVSDRAIAKVAQELARRPNAAQEIWLHVSGSVSGDACRVSETIPLSCGAMHPLCALDGETDVMAGCVAGIDGEPAARERANALAQQLSMRPLVLDSKLKPLYHAAAVTVAGHAVALFSQAVEMLSACGLDERTGRDALLPLMKRAIAKLETMPAETAMTGPVPRGDECTVNGHLKALDSLPDNTRETYQRLANRSLQLVETALTPNTLAALRKTLRDEP